MKIHVAMADRGACGHYRMKWPAEAMQRAGLDVEIHEPGPMDWLPIQIGVDAVSGRPSGRTIIGGSFDHIDVLVIQRPLTWRAAAGFEVLRQNGVRVVVDLDDDLSSLHARHGMWHRVHPRYNQESNFLHLQKATKSADALVGATPAIAARYGGAGRGVVVENCVPREWLDAERTEQHDRLVVGWTGKIATHPDSLNVPGVGLSRALAATGSDFRVIGDATGVAEQAGLDTLTEIPGVALMEYPTQVAQLDVGIAPLADSAFNRAKSWLKPLDYAATGVPFVCSPTPEYERFCAQGVGLIAMKPKDWERQLKRLLTDRSFAAEQSEAGREIAARWTFDQHVEEWYEAWSGVKA